MSYFIANSISISKDFKTFKLKGGDNNVVPRSNYWSDDIPIGDLFFLFDSGSCQLRSVTEKALFINDLVHRESKAFDGNWDEETDYYHMYHKQPTPEKVLVFNKEFNDKLIKGLKNLSNKKNWIVRMPTGYVRKIQRRSAYSCHTEKDAQLFGKYRAKLIAKKYGGIPINTF